MCSTAPRRAGLQNGPVSAMIISSPCCSSTSAAHPDPLHLLLLHALPTIVLQQLSHTQ